MLDAHAANTNPLIEEADRLYEEENYAAAFELYREVVLQGPPTRHAVGFLHISLERMGPDLMHHLLYQYPTSFAVREQATMYFRNKIPSVISVRLCTELIEENRQAGDAYDPALERYLRGVRIEAAVNWPLSPATSQEYQFFIQDFLQTWIPSTWKGWLLNAITRIWDPLFIPALSSLAEVEDLPLPVKKLLAAKIAELQALHEANAVLTETP
jgi:hypothetical protein